MDRRPPHHALALLVPNRAWIADGRPGRDPERRCVRHDAQRSPGQAAILALPEHDVNLAVIGIAFHATLCERQHHVRLLCPWHGQQGRDAECVIFPMKFVATGKERMRYQFWCWRRLYLLLQPFFSRRRFGTFIASSTRVDEFQKFCCCCRHLRCCCLDLLSCCVDSSGLPALNRLSARPASVLRFDERRKHSPDISYYLEHLEL